MASRKDHAGSWWKAANRFTMKDMALTVMAREGEHSLSVISFDTGKASRWIHSNDYSSDAIGLSGPHGNGLLFRPWYD